MAGSLIAGDVCRLMLFLVALVLFGNEVHSQVNPGLQFRVSQRGFDYAGQVAVDLLYNALHTIQIPSQSGTASLAVGRVNYAVTDMQVTGVTRPSSNVGVYPGRITWTLNDAGVSIRGNWRYDYNVWQINFGDSGSFTGSASGGSISLSASLGLQYTGHPTISGSGCSCSISSVSIRLSGGASWLYNLFIDHVERPVRDHLQSKICEAATNILNGNANRLLTSFPIQRTVATDYLFDYHFLSAPQVQSGFMDTKHKAAFYYRGDRIEAPIQASAFPPTTSGQMLTIWISDYVLNTIGYALYRQNILRYTLTKRNLPDSFKQFLDITCQRSHCFGTTFPFLSTRYPNASVEAEMTATQAPTATISSREFQVTFSGNLSIRIRLVDGSLVNFLTLSVTLKVFGWVSLTGTTLRSNVTRIVPTVSNFWSSVGLLPESAVLLAIYHVGSMLIIPKLNEKGQQGIQLPVLDYIKFKDASLQMQDHCLIVKTNVERSS